VNKIKKISLIIISILIILIIIGYFLLTSTYGIKNIVLPIVESSTGSKINVDKINVSLLESKIFFTNLTADSPNNFNIKIGKFDCTFNIFALLTKNIEVSHLYVDNSFITLIVNKKNIQNGTSTQAKTTQDNFLKQYSFKLSNIKIKNLNVTYINMHGNEAEKSIFSASNFNINVPYFKTEGMGEITTDGNVTINNGASSKSLHNKITAKIESNVNEKNIPEDLKGNINITSENNILSTILLNLSSIKQDDKQPYSLNLSIHNLYLGPYFEVFLPTTFKNSEATIKSLNLTSSGPNLFSDNILEESTGSLTLNANDVIIPVQLQKNEVTNVIFMPVEVISNLTQYITPDMQSFIPENINKIISQTAMIINGVKPLNFHTGKINTTFNDGNYNINSIDFEGGWNSIVSAIKITGTIANNGQLNIQTNTVLHAISFPIKIIGTLKNPKPDMSVIIPQLIHNNISNILQTTKNGTKSIGTELQKNTENLLNSFMTNSKKEKNKTKTPINDIINNVNSIFGN